MMTEAGSVDPHRPLIDALKEHAPIGVLAEPRLAAVVTEGVARAGKLVRGRLVRATGAALGVDPSCMLSVATAIEYFHLASLLLDDLPCMDGAQTRRGVPCAHRRHGEAAALLGALAFINRGYALMGFALAGWSRDTRLRAHASLDACLGWAGLIGGQARDLAFDGSDRSPREVGRIAAQKTTALLWLAALVPALAGHARDDELRGLHGLCLYWGLAFQALDDLQDVLGSSVAAGKSTGRDRLLARPNLAVAIGVRAARSRAARLLVQARRRLDGLVSARPSWEALETFQREFERAAALLLAGNQEAA